MVKRKDKQQPSRPPKGVIQPERVTLCILRQEFDLWYRLKVLLYDLSSVAHDPSSEKRICSTTNELHISEPYFTNLEALRLRTAVVDIVPDTAPDITSEADTEETTDTSKSQSIPTSEDATVEEAIHSRLSDFFHKRKASGDARPCGPHDMLPIYLNVFSIEKAELKDDRFLSRVRRSGLGGFNDARTT